MAQQNNKLKDTAFRVITGTNTAAKRAARFEVRSWCAEYRWLRYFSGFLSYLIQALSIAAAFYGARIMAAKGFEHEGVIIFIALVMLVCFEAGQRYSSDALWDKYWSRNTWSILWIGVSITLFASTTSIGIVGTWRSVNDIADAPELITQDSILAALVADMAMLKTEITNIEKQRTKDGVIFYKIQDRYDDKLAERSALSKEIMQRKTELEANNKQALVRSKDDVERDARVLVGVFALLALMFEVMMCFNSYYDFREECEDNEDDIEGFLARLGIIELHPTFARDFPAIAAEAPRSVGFKIPSTKPPFGEKKEPTMKAETPPPDDPATVVEVVATTATAPTTPPVATRATEFVSATDPEDKLKELLKKLSPYNSNLKNPKRNTETDLARVHEYFAEAEALDWELISDELKQRYAVIKSRIELNPNYKKFEK